MIDDPPPDEVQTGRFRYNGRLPFAIVVTLVLQAAAGLVWAGGAIERITQLENQQEDLSDLHERTARLEEKMNSLQSSLHRIENKLDRTIKTDQVD